MILRLIDAQIEDIFQNNAVRLLGLPPEACLRPETNWEKSP